MLADGGTRSPIAIPLATCIKPFLPLSGGPCYPLLSIFAGVAQW